MLSRGADSLENYLSRFRLRLLTEEWLEIVARAQPEDPFAYLIGLIEGYIRDGRGLVTCENRWCEMVMPVSEYATHLTTCSQEGKWVKCTQCNIRVEVSRMGQHRRHCQLECCIYCGEMVLPRLMDMCPYRLKMDAERACRRRGKVLIKHGEEVINEETKLEGTFHESNEAETSVEPLYSRVPIDFPEKLKQPLMSLQNLWRSTVVKERLQDVTFKYMWDVVELYRENQATRERIAVPHTNVMPQSPCPSSPISRHSLAEAAKGCISMAEFEALAKVATSGTMVEIETAMRIVSCASSILASRSLVQRVTVPEGGDVVVIGDLHGQMKDLRQALVLMGGLPNPQRYFVFNGDFVDRGPNGVEVILYIYSLLCAFPEFVFLNRGNHEDSNVNAEYGFETEVYGKYGMEDAKQLLEVLVLSYEAMPLVTVLDGAILILHGGVPRVPVTLETIGALGRMRIIPTAGQASEKEQIIVDILWNDPVDKFRSRQLGLRHQGQHWRTSKRGCGVEYLAPITEDFLQLNNLKLVVRSHEMVQAGYELIHNGKCCTVFSASNYLGVSGNRAALAVFQKGSLHPIFHTWYVRGEDGDGGLPTMQLLMQDFMMSTSMNEEDDSCNGIGDESRVQKNDSDDNCNCNDETGMLADPMEGKLLYRLNVLKALSEIIYRKRYALLSGFVAVDYKQNGILYKVEWRDVMRNVLEVDLPWYFLCQFVAVQEELDGVPCVRYVPFLKSFTARFSSRYLLPFQLAIVKRVFSEMDLPDDLLGRVDNNGVSSVCRGKPYRGDRPRHSSSDNGSVVSPPPFFTPDGGRGGHSSLFSTVRDLSDGSRSKRGSLGEPWRALKLDFNLFVSTLRSKSMVAATLEDNAMYALFQYLDQDQSGHVVLGDLVSLIECTLDDGQEEDVELMGTDDVLNVISSFNFKNATGVAPLEISGGHDAPSDLAHAATTVTSSEEMEMRGSGPHTVASHDGVDTHADNTSALQTNVLLLPSLVLAVDVDKTDVKSDGRMLKTSSPMGGRAVNYAGEGTAEDIWLYPALLRLHESFEYGSLRSLQTSFRTLNRTNDGHLTFEQLNVAMGLIGRHMRTPLTQKQCQFIFRAIRDEGRRLLYISGTNIPDGRSAFQSEMSTQVLLEDSAATVDDDDDDDDEKKSDDVTFSKKMYITMEQFVAFFSVVPKKPTRRTLRSVNDSPPTKLPSEGYCNSEVVTTSRNGTRSLLETNCPRRNSDVLRSWTVDSLLSKFDGCSTLHHVLQEIFRCSSSSSVTQAFMQENSQSFNRRTPFTGSKRNCNSVHVFTDSVESQQGKQRGKEEAATLLLSPPLPPSSSSLSSPILNSKSPQQPRKVLIGQDPLALGCLEVVGRGPKLNESAKPEASPRAKPETRRANTNVSAASVHAPVKMNTATGRWLKLFPQTTLKQAHFENPESMAPASRPGLRARPRGMSCEPSLRARRQRQQQDSHLPFAHLTVPPSTPPPRVYCGRVSANRPRSHSTLPFMRGVTVTGGFTLPLRNGMSGVVVQKRLHQT